MKQRLNAHLTSLITLKERGLRESTIKARKSYVSKLLGRLPTTVKSLESITTSDLYLVFSNHSWPSTGLLAARDFFELLYKNGITKVDFSTCVPNPKRPKTLPSVYSKDEVEKLLSSIDVNTSQGKRDYAFLMLATHMGLRSSDIVNLSLSDINYDTKTIDIVQVKTSNPVTIIIKKFLSNSLAIDKQSKFYFDMLK